MPTFSKPSAVYHERIELEEEDDEGKKKTAETVQQKVARIKASLMKGRIENNNAIAEEEAFKLTDEPTRKKLRRIEETKLKHEANLAFLKAVGIKPEQDYLMQPIAKQSMYQAKHKKDFAGEPSFASLQYERNIKRVIIKGGNNKNKRNEELEDSVLAEVISEPKAAKNRLQQDLIEKEEKHFAKRERKNKAQLGMTDEAGNKAISVQNAEYNKALDNSLKNDARVQKIKQNVERGTAI